MCAAMTIIYLLILFLSQISTLTRLKKFIIIVGTASISPLVISKLLILNQGKWNRLLYDFDREVDSGRGYVMSYAITQITDSPFFGNGLGMYSVDGRHPHNIFLQYGVDSGLFGIVLLIGFFLIITKICIDSIRFSDRDSANLALGVTSVFIFIIGNYMKSGDAYLGRDWYIVSGLALAMYGSRCFNSSSKTDVRLL